MPRRANIAGAWLIGFLDGYDWGCLNSPGIAAGLDTGAVFERMDRICRAAAEPKQSLFSPTVALIEQLRPEYVGGACLPPSFRAKP
jgi:hypothetical protein